MGAFSNPEVLRYARAQLRWDRMLSTAAICGILSLVVGYSIVHNAQDPQQSGLEFLSIVVRAQVFLLLVVGGLAALHAVQREKDLYTFDFQRVTRLTPLELTVGKLFGAPIFSYFIALCLLPAAVAGAVAGRAHPSYVLLSLAIVLLGAIGFHAFALLLSLLVDRATAIAGVVLLVLIITGIPSTVSQIFLNLGSLSPAYAAELITRDAWRGRPLLAPRWPLSQHPVDDVLFGLPVDHAFVLLALYATFTGWCLLALVRNIKRDPAVYEIFTPWQALGFAVYVNLIVVGFFRWSGFGPLDAQEVLLGVNAGVFLTLGVILLRNRDHVRRLREHHAEPPWVALSWPTPYLVPGALLIGLATVAIVEAVRGPDAAWDPWLAVVRVAVISAWILRDTLYLQWMNLRRGQRPLLVGLLYLAVFYTCAGIIFVSFRLFSTPAGTAYAGIFAPATVLALSHAFWVDARLVWIAGLGIQLLAAGGFVLLQRRVQSDLSAHAAVDARKA